MSEEKLIRQAIGGSSDAFTALMSGHERRMYAICLRICQNAEDAQDCLQDAMLRVYRSLDRFKGESAFSTWLYRVTTNTCLDALRRQKARPGTSLDALLETGWSPMEEGDTPEERAVRREMGAALREMIAELPEDLRVAVVLRDVEGLSYEELAQTLNVNVGTVKSRISRARERLRAKILQRPELFNRGIV